MKERMADFCPGILLAAPKSGSGKTVMTCALLQALKNQNIRVQAFKCGPDYIDPMFHRQIIGVASKNLDPFFSDENQLNEIYRQNVQDRDIAVLEGAMGLYDGLGGVSEEASAYQVAKALCVPVVLIVDAHGMGRSIIPLLSGFLQYDSEKLIKGVILNKVSSGFCARIAPVIEKELSVFVLGCFPNQSELHLESRHLGLKLPYEIAGLKQQTKLAAKVLEETVDIERLLKIAGFQVSASDKAMAGNALEKSAKSVAGSRTDDMTGMHERGKSKVRIAVARDEAFCFYYEDNLRLLEEYGAQLVYFSPLHDAELPENIHGLLLGGGYPELFAEALEKNESMRSSIRNALLTDKPVPSLAECGGFMYLHDKLVRKDKTAYQMCGVLPGNCTDVGRLVRFGYLSLYEKNACFLKAGETIRGHEFHYYDSTDNGSDCVAVRPQSGRQWECSHVSPEHWWGYAHLYYPSNTGFIKHFIAESNRYKQEQ